ncbi:MAG: endonuclease/exonuclease/phosphatase family protein [Bacteroidota bacterium]
MKKCFVLVLAITALLFSHTLHAAETDTIPPSQITIMSWNLKMLPRGGNAFLHHRPLKRAKLIPKKLMEENADVMVFQEMFDGAAVRILKRQLKASYPYCAGIKNRKVISYKRAGGVIMFSKYPMKEIKSIKYSQCKGIDCIGNKGSLLVEVEHPLKTLQVLGTHMQAGGGREIKISQYIEAGELLKKYEKEGVPQFAAGDFNTRNIDTVMYSKLLNALQAENGEFCTELKCTSDHLLSDMYDFRPDSRNTVDYVFYKGNGVKPATTTRSVMQYEQQWHKKHKDLSDHFAVVLRMTL